ncbi:MAG: nucleoside-diphosphate kinase [Candidatus Paceibacterota bacterium]
MTKERTLILVKPDGLMRGLVGEIVKRFEARGFKLAALKMTKATASHVKQHYLSTKQQLEGMGNKTLETMAQHKMDPKKKFGTLDPMKIGRIINQWNVEFLTSGPVVAMVFQGLFAVDMGRKIVGNTMPAKAEMGTVRGDFSVDSASFANLKGRSVRNLVHASGSVPEAKREIRHWFSKKELYEYERTDEALLFS